MPRTPPSARAPATDAPPSHGVVPTATPVVVEEPVPVDLRSVALTGLLILASFAALVAARAFFLPLAFALMLYFLLMPLVRALRRLGVPESAGPALVVVTLIGGLALSVYALSWPAAEWMERAPQAMARVQAHVQRLLRQVEPVSRQVGQLTGAPAAAAPTVAPAAGLGARVAAGVQSFLENLVVVAALLYFLLASGEAFLRALVRALPHLRDKIRAVAIAREMEKQISTFLVAFTLNNLVLGVLTALAMYLLGMPNALLWGAVAAVTNYVIILGGLFTTVALGLAALAAFEDPGRAMLVPGVFLVINIIESNVLYTLIVGRRLTLNPVVLFVSVTFWLWAWGMVGALLAVPMLAALKICSQHIEALRPLSEFLDEAPGEPRPPTPAPTGG